MNKIRALALVALGILLPAASALAAPLPPGPGSFILNSPNPQPGAQFNVSSGTVYGTLRVESIQGLSGSTVSFTASSVPASGVLPGTLGSSVVASSVSAGAISNTQIAPGTFSSITLPAANVAAGALGSSVRASSLSATGVSPGSFGAAASIPVITVSGDGRLTSAGSISPSLTNSNLQAGSYPSVTIPAANVAAGSLGASVQASSLNATGISASTFGSATQVPVIVTRGDGRLSSATSVTVTPAASSIQGGQLPSNVTVSPGGVDLSTVTSALSGKLSTTGGSLTGQLTMSGPSAYIVSGTSITAATFIGDGSNLTGIASSGTIADLSASTASLQYQITSSTPGHVVRDEGSNLAYGPYLDFVGGGVTASVLGLVTTVSVPGDPGVTVMGSKSQAELQSLSCPALPCRVQGNFGLYDVWTATATGPGQWMNTRSGTGPFD